VQQKVNRPMRKERDHIADELMDIGIDLVFTIGGIIGGLIRACPWILVIWILLIAPNCKG